MPGRWGSFVADAEGAHVVHEAGAEVIAVAVVVDRGGRSAVEEAGFEYRAAFTLADLGLE